MSGELKPCPFCRGEIPPAPVTDRHIPGKHLVLCMGCSANGPYRDTEAEAIAAWNTRAELSSLRGEDGRVVEKAYRTGYREGAEDQKRDGFIHKDTETEGWVHFRDDNPTPDSDVIGRLVGVVEELLGPLEMAAAELKARGHPPDKYAQATFANARDAIHQALASIPTPDDKP